MEQLDIGSNHPVVHFGSVDCSNVNAILTIDGKQIMKIEPGEEPGQRFRFSMWLNDRNGKPSFVIENNEIETLSQWDVEIKGTNFTLRSASKAFTWRGFLNG